MALVFSSTFGNIFNPKDFADSKSLLEVKNSKVDITQKECGARVTIIGTIYNSSEIAWEDFNFEAQFYNENDELIDTISDQNYDLLVLPNDESTFKVTGAADKPEDSYHHHIIVIKDARAINSLF